MNRLFFVWAICAFLMTIPATQMSAASTAEPQTKEQKAKEAEKAKKAKEAEKARKAKEAEREKKMQQAEKSSLFHFYPSDFSSLTAQFIPS